MHSHLMAEPDLDVESTVAAAPGGEGEEHETGAGVGREEEGGSTSEGGVQRKRRWWRALSGIKEHVLEQWMITLTCTVVVSRASPLPQH